MDDIEKMFDTPFLVAAKDDEGCVVVKVDPYAFSQPAVWGIILADFAHHVANAYSDMGHAPSVTVEAIKTMMLAEFSRPTAQVMRVDPEGEAS